MTDVIFEPSTARLITAALTGFAILLLLIIKFKFQPFIAILLSALSIGLIAGMPTNMIVDIVYKGMGQTLQGIALLVGLGSMFGAILEISGGAERVALTMTRRFGVDKAPWALGITGLVVATPVFFDAGLIILIPLAFSLTKQTKKSLLLFVLPLLSGLAAAHAFVPPTPGPILVANILGVELAPVIGLGLICGAAAMIVGVIYAKFIAAKIDVPVPEIREEPPLIDESKLPSFVTVLTIILVPLFLILLSNVTAIMPSWGFIAPVLNFLGTPFVALLIATLAAMFILGVRNGYSLTELEKVMSSSLKPTGMILLVTAGGGVLRFMIQDSGLGNIIGDGVAATALPLVVIAFIIAAGVRIALGSATVAMTMAAGIVAAIPAAADLSPLYLACMVMAIAGGASVCSHVNDSGFWLIKSLCGMDEKTTFKSWTAMVTVLGVTGFLVALIISLFV